MNKKASYTCGRGPGVAPGCRLNQAVSGAPRTYPDQNAWQEDAGLLDAQGQPEGIFCIGYNITEFVDTRSKLDSAHTQLDEIGFIQSHLVRKPLANIIGLGGLIAAELADKEVDQLCTMLKNSTAELDQLIKDISDKTDE